MHVLLIEDNDALAANIAEYLETNGDIVDFAYDGATGLRLVESQTYDVVVLDIAIPRIDGLKLCRYLRDEAGSGVPILMLTARDTLDDKLAGFDAGADDYLTKPFDLVELRARLNALNRRNLRRGSRIEVADLVFDADTQQVQRNGVALALTPVGMRLLELLLRRAPAVVGRREMEEAIWGDDPPEGDGALRVHLHVLRAAVDGPFERKLIRTVRGSGYAISDADAA